MGCSDPYSTVPQAGRLAFPDESRACIDRSPNFTGERSVVRPALSRCDCKSLLSRLFPAGLSISPKTAEPGAIRGWSRAISVAVPVHGLTINHHRFQKKLFLEIRHESCIFCTRPSRSAHGLCW
jgi:hypothetical protein